MVYISDDWEVSKAFKDLYIDPLEARLHKIWTKVLGKKRLHKSHKGYIWKEWLDSIQQFNRDKDRYEVTLPGATKLLRDIVKREGI